MKQSFVFFFVLHFSFFPDESTEVTKFLECVMVVCVHPRGAEMSGSSDSML